ncbi:MAG: DUF4465 domain-containing protein [Bacteroidales bacterium]|nr:DUF4465 domain-containing protein [Bacteroidales bacterium]
MKLKTLILTALVLGGMAAACNPSATSTSNYTAICTFEYDDIDNYLVDSLITTFQDYIFSGADGLSFIGPDLISPCGFIISVRHDPLLADGHVAKDYAVLSKTAAHGVTYVVYVDQPGAPVKQTVNFDYVQYGTCALNGFIVNNTNKVATLATYGLGEAPAFAPGDWMKLTVTGYKGSTKGNSVEVLLADYTGPELKVIKEWTAVETKDFGEFTTLSFSVTSNRDDVPLEVCMDYLQASISVEY